ncbi:MFS transporter [Castellaniella sp.]|uniref:MFS transporter n=1 Tax=Castellaniella sp. TaxID=1955812 RepID=UPI002AFE14E8|nr:MFS transporter [Castellaniella sp.]
MTGGPSWRASQALPWRAGLSYGLLGLPLAFAALPLYVVLPHYYADDLGLPLSTVGALLLLVRLMDAGADPLLGRLSDLLYRRSIHAVLWTAGASALLLGGGMAGLFLPLVRGTTALAAWMVAGLLFTCLAHSLLLIAHQAWGVQLGGDRVQRSRIVAWREGLGLIGVVAASALSVAWGAGPMLGVFALALLAGWLTLWQAPRPPLAIETHEEHTAGKSRLWQPLTQASFRRLLAVFLCNGIASAIPAALMLFFAQDRLLASPSQIALFLTLYFVSGALSMPAWLQFVRRFGLERAWLAGMLLAVACFGWAAALQGGQLAAFAVICVLSGAALGADLVAPGALLALLIERHGAQGAHDGAYLGWWNLATKLNLALAAGVTLPLLQWLGYVPGSQDPLALQRLAWIYALLPCALKLAAAWLLHSRMIAPQNSPTGAMS